MTDLVDETDLNPAGENESETVRINRFSRFVVQPILIALMVTAVGNAVLSVLLLGPTPRPWRAILLPVFVMALEGIFTAIWLSREEQRLLNKPLYRLAEVLLLVVLLRLYTWLVSGNWPLSAEFIDYLRDPLALFGDPLFVASLALILATWSWAISLSAGFQVLALDPSELSFYDVPIRDRPKVERPTTPFRSNYFEQFGRQWLWGAVGLVTLAAASTVDYGNSEFTSMRTISRLPLAPGMLISLLVYFGAGFALISQGRLAIMNARWLFADSQKTAEIERSWFRHSGLVLLVIGTIAAFLPLGSTTLIGRAIEFLLWLVFQIFNLIAYVIAWFFSLFISGEREQPELEFEEFNPAPFIPPEQIPLENGGEPGFPFVGTLFWIIAIVVTIMAVVFFLRDRGIKIAVPNWSKLKQGLISWWQSLWRIVVEQSADLRDALLTRLVREEVGRDGNSPWGFIRLNSLSPRQKLRYFYLSTVQRAETGSLAKRDSDTPLEYAAELKGNLPEVANAIDTVTAGFLLARYRQNNVTSADVERIEPEWKRLRQAVKKSGRSPQNE